LSDLVSAALPRSSACEADAPRVALLLPLPLLLPLLLLLLYLKFDLT
jgi:hypothetical protein